MALNLIIINSYCLSVNVLFGPISWQLVLPYWLSEKAYNDPAASFLFTSPSAPSETSSFLPAVSHLQTDAAYPSLYDKWSVTFRIAA